MCGKVKLREIADTLMRSNSSAFCSKLMPRLLTFDQKQPRAAWRNKRNFYMRYVTLYETRAHHYTLESN